MSNSEDCVFCALYAGGIVASSVFRSEHVMAAMTIRPMHVGHVLLFPKVHVEDFALLDQAELGREKPRARREPVGIFMST